MTTPAAGSKAPAFVRTGAPMGAGSVIVFIAKTFGLNLTVDQALILLPIVMFLYYTAGRALESYNPKLGYVLGIAKQPAYAAADAPAPDEGEHLEAVVVDDDQPVNEPIEVHDVDDGSGEPVQTDNGPKPGDLVEVPVETFSGEMR